ncbi:hypothetical protein PAT3040_04850 [Paenibacillus agaridevorans]|uniref:SLH domain-containing protein n=1 Tax=Paenibacillus agaridevorans TaxID=171404 RepID=A0A2R5ETW9_9BACL|nr:S-layer homology domain-containing protein [Paenibacillus agaridevorans]GBG10132.1 hypothetical protein PAT3040_04850 [Paenibacillus agaridevorans]
MTRVKFRRWILAVSLIVSLLATNLFHVSVYAADSAPEKVDYWKFEGVSAGSYELVGEPDVHQGKYALQFEFNADSVPNKYYFAKQSIPVEADTNYSISLWAKGDSVGRAWFGGGPGWALRSNLTGTYDWKEFSINYKTGSNQTSFDFMILLEGRTTNLWVDEVRMVKQGTDGNLIRNGSFEGKSIVLSANPPAGEVKRGTKLSLAAEGQEATIYYTTDGSDPNHSATAKAYEQPIMIDKAVQIKAYARTSDGGEIEPIAFNYTIAAEAEGEELLDFEAYIAAAGKGRKVPIRKTAPLEVDGNWDKWHSSTGILLPDDKERQVLMSDWKGPEDLSAEAKFAYDDDALYIAIKVEDNIHHGVADGDMWLGDSLQLAFTPDTELYGPEYGFNVLNDGRKQIWRWSDGEAKLPKEAVEYHVSRNGTTTNYEAKLPWEAILADKPDSKVSMTLLINDNDGNARRGWIEWTGAIGRGKNPKDMAELLLLQEDETWTVVLDGPTEFAAGFNQQYDLAIPNFGEETITLAVTSEILGLQNYEAVIPGGKVWKKELPLTMREQGSYTLSVSAQSLTGNLVKQDQLAINVLANPQDLAVEFEQLRLKLPALAALLTTAETAGLAVDYERVNYTIIDQFIAYGLEDIDRQYYDRASYVIKELEKLYEEAAGNVQAYLSGEKIPFVVDRYVTGSIDIDKTAFIADTRSSKSDEIVRKPVLFTGYGHFAQAKKDIPLFKEYGANAIQIEIGPNSVIKPKENFTDWNIDKSSVSAQAVRDLMIGHGDSGGSLRISNQTPKSPGKYINVWQEVNIEPDTTYEIKVWAKGEGVNNAWFPGGPGWVHRSSFPQGTFDWQEFTYEYKSGQNDRKFRLMFASENVTQNLWIDDVRMYVKNGSGENLVVNGSFDANKFVELGNDDYVGDIVPIQKNVIEPLKAAEENDVAVTLLLSPHYFPAWALEKWPELRSNSLGIKFAIDNPRARQLMEDYLRLVIPLVKDYKSLHSITLSNESVHHSNMDEANTPAWQEYLEEKYEGDIAALNALHRTNYTSFSDVALPDRVTRTPAFYDYVKFNNKFFSDWHKWMGDIIHEMAPDLPLHAKIMNRALDEIGNLTWGVDPEEFSQLSQINGNDNYNIYGSPTRNFTSELKFYDLQTSMKQAPIFNSEHHMIVDGEERYIPEFAPHVRSVLWQGGIHGLSAATIWVWERTYDQNSDFKGSILHRPDVIAAVGRTHLDLNRLADQVTAFQQDKAEVAILYSIPAVMYDVDHPAASNIAYEAISYSGLKVGFVSENQIASGALANIKTLFIPNAKHVQASTFDALKPFVDNGGKLVIIGDQSLSFDEYDRPLPTVERDVLLQHEDTLIFPAAASSLALRNAMTSEFEEQGLINVQLMDTDSNELVFETEWRSVQHDGKLLINATNYTWSDKTVRVVVNGETVTNWKNLITGETHSEGESLLLVAHEPVLLELPLTGEEVEPIAHNSSFALNLEAGTTDQHLNGTLQAEGVSNLRYEIVANGKLGTVELRNEATGEFVYTPHGYATGEDSFTFRVHDGNRYSNTATVTITIAASPVVNPPVYPGATESASGQLYLPAGGAGEVSLDRQMKLTIPAGATDTSRQFAIARLEEQKLQDLQAENRISPVFELSQDPAGAFKKKVILRIAFDAGKSGEEQKPTLMRYDVKQKMWIKVEGKVDGDSFIAEVDQLGIYAVMVLKDEAAGPQPTKELNDIAGHWGQSWIEKAVQAGIVTGYADQTYRPDQAVTRQELIVMLARTLTPQAGTGQAPSFTDKETIGKWAADAVTSAVEAGWIAGYDDGSFRPEKGLTRVELAAVLARVIAGTDHVGGDAGLSQFRDAEQIPLWAQSYVAQVAASGLMEGTGAGLFKPAGIVTRAEAAAIVVRLKEQSAK